MSEHTSESPRPDWTGKKFLVVDDDLDITAPVGAALRAMGCVVRTADDAEDGLRLADEFRPDVVWLDYEFPGMSGLEVCRRLREREWSSGAKILLCTAHDDPGLQERALEAGADAFVEKRRGEPAADLARRALEWLEGPSVAWEFFRDIARDDMDDLRELLALDFPLETRLTKDGETPLMFAARLGRAEAVKLLLEKGADSGASDRTRRTALDHARDRGDTAIEDMLLRQAGSQAQPERGRESSERARVLVVDDDRMTAALVEDLLELEGFETRVALDGERGLAVAREFRPDVVITDTRMRGMDGFGLSAALKSTLEGCDVRVILVTWGTDEGWDLFVSRARAHGVDSCLLKSEFSRLMGAVREQLSNRGRVQSQPVSVGLSRGISRKEALSTEGPGAAEPARRGEAAPVPGAEELCRASAEGDFRTVQLLLERGADAEVRDADGLTPLMIAVKNGFREVAMRLLDKGADIEAKRADRWPFTALQLAVEGGRREMVELLVDRGADINVWVHHADPVLLLADKNRHAELVGLLLARGADPLLKGDSSFTPLEAAAARGDVRSVEILTASKPECAAESELGASALRMAAMEGKERVVRWLLRNGADINGRDKEGMTALMVAALHGHRGMVELLLENKADPRVVSRTGDTARDYAALQDHDEIAAMLEPGGASPGAKKPISEEEAARRRARRTKVLVVEDSDIVVELLKTVLEAQGYEAREAFNGRRGFEIALEFLPDIVVSDVMMPELDGLSMASEIKRKLGEDAPEFIFMTRPDTEASVAKAGYECTVGKPFEVADFRRKMEMLEEMSKASRPAHGGHPQESPSNFASKTTRSSGPRPPKREMGPPRVLIVDDEGEVRTLIRLSVLAEGFEVREASNGASGLAAAFDFEPALVIADVMMPVMDGYSMTQRLSEDPRTRHTPVILLTAKGKLSNLYDSTHNVVNCVEKPFDPPRLREIVKAIIADLTGGVSGADLIEKLRAAERRAERQREERAQQRRRNEALREKRVREGESCSKCGAKMHQTWSGAAYGADTTVWTCESCGYEIAT